MNKRNDKNRMRMSHNPCFSRNVFAMFAFKKHDKAKIMSQSLF